MTLIGTPRRGLRRSEQFPARTGCPGCCPVLSRAAAGGPGHRPVHSLAVARGPGQPVHTPAGAGVQGCPFALKPLRGVQGGGVVFAALTCSPVNCQFTHPLPRGARAFLFSHSLSRGVQGALIRSLFLVCTRGHPLLSPSGAQAAWQTCCHGGQ